MTARHSLPDCQAFRDMWMGRVNRNKIADRFGVTVVNVTQLARAYGYPNRSQNKLVPDGPLPARRPAADPKGLKPERETPAVAPAKVMALAGDRWSVEQVTAVFRANGKYAVLNSLAAQWGVPVVALVGLWNRVRVTA